MPPKAKFTRDEIVQAALTIVREEGFSALTARALGRKLGSSARPVFTVFQNMEEVAQAVVASAKKLYAGYIEIGLSHPLPFKGVGTQYILFSIREPKLYQLLFMSEQEAMPDFLKVLPLIEDHYDKILSSIQSYYGLDGDAALKVYRHMWIYTHGIGTLCATKTCSFTSETIGSMLAEVAASLLGSLGKPPLEGPTNGETTQKQIE